MKVQRWILHEVLNTYDRHPNNFAYLEHVTTLQCVQRHAGATWMIKTDLHNYFPSITEPRVYRVFRRMGYASLLAFEMARLCTWPRPGSSSLASLPGLGTGTPKSLPYARIPSGSLPQGAPTSGALANATTWSLDDSLSVFAGSHGLVYTRYSDDMAFSSGETFDRSRIPGLVQEIRRIVVGHGFELHRQKTKVIPPGARKMLLGMLVTKTGVAILPEHRRRIDLYIHCVNRYGPEQFANRRKFDSPIAFINHVEGWLAYLHHIDPDWVGSRSAQWEAALANHGVSSSILG